LSTILLYLNNVTTYLASAVDIGQCTIGNLKSFNDPKNDSILFIIRNILVTFSYLSEFSTWLNSSYVYFKKVP